MGVVGATSCMRRNVSKPWLSGSIRSSSTRSTWVQRCNPSCNVDTQSISTGGSVSSSKPAIIWRWTGLSSTRSTRSSSRRMVFSRCWCCGPGDRRLLARKIIVHDGHRGFCFLLHTARQLRSLLELTRSSERLQLLRLVCQRACCQRLGCSFDGVGSVIQRIGILVHDCPVHRSQPPGALLEEGTNHGSEHVV